MASAAKDRSRLKINLRGKNTGVPQTNTNRTSLSPSIPKINVEDVLLTDVEQSSDEMDEKEFEPKEVKDLSKYVEMEGGYEEKVDKVGRNKAKNKTSVYSRSCGNFGLRPKERDTGGLTDVEEFASSDVETGQDDKEIAEDPDVLNRYLGEREVIAISDEMKGSSQPSPSVTPEPFSRQGLRRRKTSKSAKDQSSKLSNSNKTFKNSPYLVPGVEVSSTLTDTELLLSDSGDENKKKLKKIPIEGWVTDVDEIAISSADEYLQHMRKIKTSNSVNDFFLLGESGSEDEMENQNATGRKYRSLPRKKSSSKVTSGKQNTAASGWQYNTSDKPKSGMVCTNYNGERHHQTSRKMSDERRKSAEGNFYSNHNAILSQQSQSKSRKGQDQVRVSSQCSSIREMANPTLMQSFTSLVDDGDTEVECFDSDGEEFVYSDCRKQSKRSQHSKLTPHIIQSSSSRNASAFVSVQSDSSSRNPSPSFSLPENSVIVANENVRENRGLQVYSIPQDPLTDTEELVLSGGKKSETKPKKKLTKSLNVPPPEIAVTDVEDLDLSDCERPYPNKSQYLSAKADTDNATTDVDEFSANEDTEDELNDYIPPVVATPEHFRYIRGNTTTTDREGSHPILASMTTEKNYCSDQDQDIPRIHTISPSPTFHPTDIEDMCASADDDESSGNETPVQGEEKLAFEDHYSVIHMKNTRRFQLEGEETLHVKGGGVIQEPVTDVEDIFTQEDSQQVNQSKKTNSRNSHNCKRNKKEGQSKTERSGFQSPPEYKMERSVSACSCVSRTFLLNSSGNETEDSLPNQTAVTKKQVVNDTKKEKKRSMANQKKQASVLGKAAHQRKREDTDEE